MSDKGRKLVSCRREKGGGVQSNFRKKKGDEDIRPAAKIETGRVGERRRMPMRGRKENQDSGRATQNGVKALGFDCKGFDVPSENVPQFETRGEGKKTNQGHETGTLKILKRKRRVFLSADADGVRRGRRERKT